MNRKDIVALVALVMLLMVWMMFGPVIERKLYPPSPVDIGSSESPLPGAAGTSPGGATVAAEP